MPVASGSRSQGRGRVAGSPPAEGRVGGKGWREVLAGKVGGKVWREKLAGKVGGNEESREIRRLRKIGLVLYRLVLSFHVLCCVVLCCVVLCCLVLSCFVV